jgi:hypothetical protein
MKCGTGCWFKNGKVKGCDDMPHLAQGMTKEELLPKTTAAAHPTIGLGMDFPAKRALGGAGSAAD